MSSRVIQPRVLVAVLLLVVGVVLAGQAWSGPANAMLVPRVVLTLWSVIALAITVMELASHQSRDMRYLSPLPLLMASVLAAAVAVASLGFLVPSLPLVALTLWLFRVRRPVSLLMGTLVIAGGLWFLFHHVLLIRLPTLMTNGGL
ncbi:MULTISPECIES: tripartite tricarboxylate transporter TctB family protein [unclassified Modicisalibacter]|uniref:tripartite tricarboxylate transporter TctB family protein n=1 Tax=unclassified Modicisalibacter TaxID=2679913 RepID=UPI001CC99A6A|nr:MULTISPECIES: tripartite tricarboxylate transporter TctB family protein [unclassified Modicisalibacter]MBZ9558622.1 tripartite tricarboxylate transporter TctB family protein [Modicisalibacter sp. R2A 31.J]MBZ9575486.1 tripartite tricarboxylate transporter TctB family protein [Modicisalibacter sp. MOD 31.J]